MANLITLTFEFPSYDIFMRDIVYKMEEYYKGMIECDMIHNIDVWEYTMLRQIWANMNKDETMIHASALILLKARKIDNEDEGLMYLQSMFYLLLSVMRYCVDKTGVNKILCDKYRGAFIEARESIHRGFHGICGWDN